jgi:hypothetical protein
MPTAAVLSLTGGASTAFAGWTAQPTKPTTAQIADAERVCSAQIPIKGLPLVLSDTRGPFTFRIYANSDTMTDCTVGPSFTHTSGLNSDGPIAPPAGQAKLGVAHVTTRDGKAYSFSQGAVGDGVTGVTLHLADGSTVTATVQGGWYVAWWPGSTEFSSADVTTASGTHTQAFHEKPCPAGADCQATEDGGSGRGTVTSFSSVGQQ